MNEPISSEDKNVLKSMFYNLVDHTTEFSWAENCLKNDMLAKSISTSEQSKMIEDAINCGRMYAEEVLSQEPFSFSVAESMKKCGLKIEYADDSSNDSSQILFAKFTVPNQVTIMTKPIKDYLNYRTTSETETLNMPDQETIEHLLLGHEWFHWIEEKNKEDIYTKNKTIELWSFWKYSHRSTVRSLSEIAAASFTKTLNSCPYSPFILDILLMYSYDKKAARSNYSAQIK